MDNPPSYLKIIFIGAAAIFVPLLISFKLIAWAATSLSSELVPAIEFLVQVAHLPLWLSYMIAASLVLALCFLFGIMVITPSGIDFRKAFEAELLRKIPGYSFVRDRAKALMSRNKISDYQPVLVSPWGQDSYFAGFLVEKINDDFCTVFVPTSPNPGSGIVLHVRHESLITLDGSLSDISKSVIAFGLGSSGYLKQCLDSKAISDNQRNQCSVLNSLQGYNRSL